MNPLHRILEFSGVSPSGGAVPKWGERSSRHAQQRDPSRHWIALGTTIVYFLAVTLNAQLAVSAGTAPSFSPATGIAIAALLLGGNRLWPCLALGALAAYSLSASFGVALVSTLGILSEALLGAAIIRRMRRAAAIHPFEDITAWLAAALLSPLAFLAFSGVLSFSQHGGITPEMRGQLIGCWLGHALGAMAVGPVLTSLREIRRPGWFGVLGLLALPLLAAPVCQFAFATASGSSAIFVVFPLIMLCTVLLGGFGARVTGLAIVLFAIHFATPDASSSPAAYLHLSAFLLAVAFCANLAAVLEKCSAHALPLSVLFAGWILSGWIYWTLDRDHQKLEAIQFENLIEQAQRDIKQRMQTYIDALYGGASLFAASADVTRQEWNRYAESINLVDRYPGILGMSVIFPVSEAELPEFVARMRKDGAPDFQIQALGNGGNALNDPAGWKHFVIGYIEPMTGNRAALGIDVATEQNRFSAARISRDFGEPRLSKPVTLAQDGKTHQGVILFVPMYRPGTDHDTAHRRRNNFRGWIAAPLATSVFFEHALAAVRDQIDLSLYEGLEPSPKTLIYGPASAPATGARRTNVIQLAGEEFTCKWTATNGFTGQKDTSLLDAIMLALVPTLLAGMITSLQTASQRANAQVALRTEELRKAQDEAQHAREIAESANTAKSEFLAMMSHEIRTPINAVIGYTDLLVESPLTEEQISWAGTIQTSGQSLLSLINDILDFSKIEAGRLTLENIPFRPRQCAREVVDILRFQAKQKNLLLEIKSGDAVPEAIAGDPVRFRQILMNLVSNAIKFTPSGSVIIELDSRKGTGLFASVTDTGIGIPQEKQDRLFQRFSQVDSSTTRRYGGTGLGLAICKRLVELMGGEIGVKSSESQGTTIWFTAPLPACEPAERSSLPISTETPRPGDGRRVLVADDVPANQKLAKTLLTRLGCTVEIASSGREAIALAADGQFDLIFMDCQMPDVDGYDATRQIRRLENGHMKIYALTASALDGDRKRCADAGMDGYLSKPFKRSDFVDVLLHLPAVGTQRVSLPLAQI